MKWNSGNELPKESGLYVCRCLKRGDGTKSETVTYGRFAEGFKYIFVDKEKFGEVIEWLDESGSEPEGKEAVELLEWIISNKIEYLFDERVWMVWYRENEVLIATKYTSNDFFNFYKQNKIICESQNSKME